MSRDTAAIVIALFFGGLLMLLVFHGIISSNNDAVKVINSECVTKFGKEWSGRFTTRYPAICVNPQGEIKYP